MGEWRGQAGFSCAKELSLVFPGGFYFFLTLLSLIRVVRRGRTTMGIWHVSHSWLNFLALFFHFLRFCSGATHYKQRVVAMGGWPRRMELIVQACNIKRK